MDPFRLLFPTGEGTLPRCTIRSQQRTLELSLGGAGGRFALLGTGRSLEDLRCDREVGGVECRPRIGSAEPYEGNELQQRVVDVGLPGVRFDSALQRGLQLRPSFTNAQSC